MFHEKGNATGINQQTCDAFRAYLGDFPHHLLQPWPLAVVLQEGEQLRVVLQRERTGNMRDVIQQLENITAAGIGSAMQRVNGSYDLPCAQTHIA